jgi:cytochrome c-type biogenesis protein CcmH/NrfG
MAFVKHICSSCGAEVAAGIERCPQCAEPLEWAKGEQEHTTKCPVCGYQNPAGNDVCQSCGARLAGGKARHEGRPAPSGQGRKNRVSAAASQQTRTQRRFEPWQIVSGVAVLALVGFLLYQELSRPSGPSSAMSPAMPPQVMQPQMQAMQDVSSLERAVAAHPDDPAALVELANTLHDNGAYPRAIETYRKYLALKPDDPNARVDMGICYYQLAGQDTAHSSLMMSTAIKEMETALKGSPRHQPAAFNLGVVNLTMGDIGQARAWFQKAITIDKNSELGTKAQKMLDQHAFTP